MTIAPKPTTEELAEHARHLDDRTLRLIEAHEHAESVMGGIVRAELARRELAGEQLEGNR